MMKTNKKNLILFSLFIALFVFPVFSFAEEEVTENPEAKAKIPFTLFATMGSHFQYNAAPLPSAPSPALFSFGIGGKFDLIPNLSLQPCANFTATYYLLQDECGLPAAPESRTAYVPSLLIDLPVCYEFPVKNTTLSIGAGIALNARYGFLATKVPSTEQESINKINSYFWSKGRFVYPSIQAAFDFNLSDNTACGFIAKLFFPVSSSISSDYSFFQDGIFYLGARIHLLK